MLVPRRPACRATLPRFMNNGVMGSMFTRYKSPALVNLDWTTTFTPELLRKDLDLGLSLGTEMGVPMPVTAAAREVLQQHFGAAQLQARSGKISAGDLPRCSRRWRSARGSSSRARTSRCRGAGSNFGRHPGRTFCASWVPGSPLSLARG